MNDIYFTHLLELLGLSHEEYLQLGIVDRLNIVEKYQGMSDNGSNGVSSSGCSINNSNSSNNNLLFSSNQPPRNTTRSPRRQISLDVLNTDFERNKPPPIIDK